eukprot:scaffold1768_cov275-Chaetoceros_neogracile.AAC.7
MGWCGAFFYFYYFCMVPWKSLCSSSGCFRAVIENGNFVRQTSDSLKPQTPHQNAQPPTTYDTKTYHHPSSIIVPTTNLK